MAATKGSMLLTSTTIQCRCSDQSCYAAFVNTLRRSSTFHTMYSGRPTPRGHGCSVPRAATHVLVSCGTVSLVWHTEWQRAAGTVCAMALEEKERKGKGRKGNAGRVKSNRLSSTRRGHSLRPRDMVLLESALPSASDASPLFWCMQSVLQSQSPFECRASSSF